MKRKVFCLVISGMMSLSLILAACGPAAAPTTPTAPAAPASPVSPAAPAAPATPAAEKPQQEAAPTPEKPRYGGTFNMVLNAEILGFDPAFPSTGIPTRMVQETLMESDWGKGPAGTGQSDMLGVMPPTDFFRPLVAESYEIPTIGTMIFNIRRGVRYGLNPASEASKLMNGRELTADDVVFSVNRQISATTSPTRTGAPEMSRNASANKTGPWQVTIKTPVDPWWGFANFFGTWASYLEAPDVVTKYGDTRDWRNLVGTGPFMLTEYVPGSAATLKRNQNYWDKNPVGPGKGDQLPYADAIRLLIIPDVSTRLAALRTAKLDWASPVSTEDAVTVKLTSKELKYEYYWGSYGTTIIGMRLDKPELPFKDLKVRQGLMLATNFDSIVKDLFMGDADVQAWPTLPDKVNRPAYMPLSEMPANVQALYKYGPEKAKQLLKEAGYPNGFKTKIVVTNTPALIDRLSVIKDMWAKIGVDLEIQPKEPAVYNSLSTTRSYEELIYKGAPGGTMNIGTMSAMQGETHWNMSYVRDPKVGQVHGEIQKNIVINMPKVFQLYHDLLPYALEQAWVIPTPFPHQYTFWWPWVKNYQGEIYVMGFAGYTFAKFVWIDQDLKKQMGH